MRESLKNRIQSYLEKNSRMSLLELESLCKSEGYKLSNAERRLRELMRTVPAIRPEKNAIGVIVGYRYIAELRKVVLPTMTAENFLKMFPSKVEEVKKSQLTLNI